MVKKDGLKKYVVVSLKGGGTYTQPIEEILQTIDAEFDDAPVGMEINLRVIEITKSEYASYPEFMGH